MSKTVVETQSKFVGKAQPQSLLIFRVAELLFAVPVTEKSCICREAEVSVYRVAYPWPCTNAYAVSVFCVTWVVVAEFECPFPEQVESVDRVYKVSQIRGHGVCVTVHTFILEVLVAYACPECETFVHAVANLGSDAYRAAPLVVIVPKVQTSAKVHLCIGGQCQCGNQGSEDDTFHGHCFCIETNLGGFLCDGAYLLQCPRGGWASLVSIKNERNILRSFFMLLLICCQKL